MPPDVKEGAPNARLTPPQIILSTVAFAAVLLLGDRLVQWVAGRAWIDPPRYWPFSVFNPREPKPLEWAFAAGCALAAWAGARRLARSGYPAAGVVALGILLGLGTNAVQGVPKGYSYPVEGGIKGKEQYYHDALQVRDAGDFLRRFNAAQPSLRIHSRTHPPGAVLLYYGLGRATQWQPAVVGVCITVAATLLAAWAVPRFVAGALGAEGPFAGYATLLYLLLPVVQVYYCATLDAVIASLLLAGVALYAGGEGRRVALVASLPLTAASFLTFGVAWVVPVLLLVDAQRKTWKRMPWLLAAPLAFYGSLYALFGYDHLAALRTASRLENPEGFRLFAEPLTYAFTRLENVAEMLAFLGPFLLLLAVRGLPVLRQDAPRAFALFLVAVGTLGALFLTGAYHTGETARVCLFLYPYLLLPVLALLRNAGGRERALPLGLAFGQALLMQLFGNWFW